MRESSVRFFVKSRSENLALNRVSLDVFERKDGGHEGTCREAER